MTFRFPTMPMDSDEKCRFIASCDSFADMPASLLGEFAAACVEQRLEDGQCIYRRDDQAESMYGIVRGAMRMNTVNVDGREAVLTYMEPGSWFGEISLFDGLPRSHDARAVGPSVLLAVSKPRIDELCRQEPVFYRQFLLVMAAKLRMSLAWIEDSTLLPFPARLAKRLLPLVNHYGLRVADGIVLELRLSQESIAAMLGVTRQSINQELKDWERRGIVRVDYGRITVTDMEALRTLACTI